MPRKPLPKRITMRATLFADGAKGMYLQVHRSERNKVNRTVLRESRDDDPIEVWTIDRLPDMEFKSYKELKEMADAT